MVLELDGGWWMMLVVCCCWLLNKKHWRKAQTDFLRDICPACYEFTVLEHRQPETFQIVNMTSTLSKIRCHTFSYWPRLALLRSREREWRSNLASRTARGRTCESGQSSSGTMSLMNLKRTSFSNLRKQLIRSRYSILST